MAALNSVVRNSLYMDAAVKELEAGGVTISKDIRSRLSPLIHEHIIHSRYPIVRSHGDGALRTLRDPSAEQDEEDEERGGPVTGTSVRQGPQFNRFGEYSTHELSLLPDAYDPYLDVDFSPLRGDEPPGTDCYGQAV